MNNKLIIIIVLIVIASLFGYLLVQEFKPKIPMEDTRQSYESVLGGQANNGPESPEIPKEEPSEEDEKDQIVRELSNRSRSTSLSKEYLVKCSPCHNRDGSGPLGVELRGQSKEALIGKLMAFKRGEVENNLMKNLIMNISEEEIERLAEEISKF